MGRHSQQHRKTLPHPKAFHSMRVGKHCLPLSGFYESIEIGHRAWDRRDFARGGPLGRQLAPPAQMPMSATSYERIKKGQTHLGLPPENHWLSTPYGRAILTESVAPPPDVTDSTRIRP
jgi:hypothetical protein